MNAGLRRTPVAIAVVVIVLSLAAACKSTPAKAPTPNPAAVGIAPPPTAAAIRTPGQTPVRGSTVSVAPVTTVVAVAGTPGLVTITATGASPETISVQSGRPITWKNADSAAHQIVSDEAGLFDTGLIAPGGSAVTTVSASGTHDWHDRTTPALKGTVRILP